MQRRDYRTLPGQRQQRTTIYPMPVVPKPDFELSVTDVPCPKCRRGKVRRVAGRDPLYRICDLCGRNFVAEGSPEQPALAYAHAVSKKEELIRLGLRAR